MAEQKNPEEGEPGLSAPTAPHVGMVAVVGRANVGKSTLVNRLLGEKISIVSPIAQTTRNRVRGVLTETRGQIVFLDTPGVHKASSDLGKVMNRMARASIEGVDVVLLVTDASTQPRQEDEGWIRKLMREEAPCFVVLNKADLGTDHAPSLEQVWRAESTRLAPGRLARWFTLSAETGEGTEGLLEALFAEMPEGPYLFPEDVLTDFPRKLAIADVIREKLIRDLRQELPHSIAVLVNSIDEEDEAWHVDATVYARKSSQKGIVIGQKGRRLRAARRASAQELSAIYERPVTVALWVKVENEWPRNYWFLKRLGYVE